MTFGQTTTTTTTAAASPSRRLFFVFTFCMIDRTKTFFSSRKLFGQFLIGRIGRGEGSECQCQIIFKVLVPTEQNRKEGEKYFFHFYSFFSQFSQSGVVYWQKNLLKKQKLNHQMHRERIFIITARFGCCQVWNNCLISRPLKTNTIIIIVQMWTISFNLL